MRYLVMAFVFATTLSFGVKMAVADASASARTQAQGALAVVTRAQHEALELNRQITNETIRSQAAMAAIQRMEGAPGMPKALYDAASGARAARR